MKERQFFLFNDVLLLCLKEGEKYRLRYLISLNPSVKVEDEESGWSDFRVVSPGSDTKGKTFRSVVFIRLLQHQNFKANHPSSLPLFSLCLFSKGLEFRISALKKLLVFFARTSAEQKEWVSLIRQAAANQH